jgi:hypothetical protein
MDYVDLGPARAGQPEGYDACRIVGGEIKRLKNGIPVPAATVEAEHGDWDAVLRGHVSASLVYVHPVTEER